MKDSASSYLSRLEKKVNFPHESLTCQGAWQHGRWPSQENLAKILCMLLAVSLICVFTPGVAHSIPADSENLRLERLIDILQERYDRTTAISAHFRQKTYAAGDPEGVFAEGKVYFKRPHLMRWEYEKPARQLIVTSGNDVYIYEIEARQVTILPRKQFLSSEISRAFFFGKGDLRREFNVAPPPKDSGDPSWSLCLLPKRQIPQLKRLIITLAPESHLIRKVVIEDQMGGKTLIEFSNMRVNQKLSPSLFSFTIPKGVEVYQGQ